jgi:hypothetical protein
MTETTQTVEEKSTPDTTNRAVETCCKAHARALKAAKKQSDSQSFAADQAEKAYRKAMPTLSGSENIRDFIACVVRGMLIDAIPNPVGSRLLYAAQLASAVRTQPTPPKSTAN